MLAPAPTSPAARKKQQKSDLLPPSEASQQAELPPRERRAHLSGQHAYRSRYHGTSATQTELAAFLKRKQQQWRSRHTSVGWQTYFLQGWQAAVLADPTAEHTGSPPTEEVRTEPADTELGTQEDTSLSRGRDEEVLLTSLQTYRRDIAP